MFKNLITRLQRPFIVLRKYKPGEINTREEYEKACKDIVDKYEKEISSYVRDYATIKEEVNLRIQENDMLKEQVKAYKDTIRLLKNELKNSKNEIENLRRYKEVYNVND